MKKIAFGIMMTLGAVVSALPARAADTYKVDAVHSSAVFKISHLGLSYIYGRFNDLGGEFILDPANPAQASFTLAVKTESVDTNNPGRDKHLKGPDFFNAKQFPLITFKSTSVKPVEGGYDVMGDLTMHGVTRPITVAFRGGKTAQFPPGVQRTGFSADLEVRRSEFGMDRMVGPAGDEVKIGISFEGTKQ